MKRLLFIGIVLAMSAPAFAQKANVKKVKSKVDFASTPMNYDFSNVEADKVQELRELIDPALTDPESKDMADTWKYAARLKVYDMNQLLAQYQANGNQFPDPNAFFQNQYDVVKYYETYYQLMNTPNEKGKLPYKEDEMKAETEKAKIAAKGARVNLLIGATNLVYTNPTEAVKLLDLYYESIDNPLFEGMNLRAEDPNLPLGYYTYAVALKATNGDEATYLDYLQKSLDTDNGPLAAQDLLNYYKEKGDKENEKKVTEMAFEKFPNQIVFAVSLIQDEIQARNYDKAVELCNTTIARIDDGTIAKVDNNGNAVESIKWPYYFKAAALYNTEKYEPAYEAFLQLYEMVNDPEYLSNAANCCTRIAYDTDKADVRASWYKKAIEYYETCESLVPDRPELWGVPLYTCYNNTGNTAKANAYKKYMDSNK